MEVLNSLKQIYSGKDTLQNHVMLFSISGLVTLAALKLLASWGNALFLNFFALPPHNHYEMFLYIFILVFAVLYLIGYFFKYIHSIRFSSNANLIDFDLKSFLIFFRAFPMFFVWQNYILILFVAGILLFTTLKLPLLAYLSSAVLLCCVPFEHLLLVDFSANFRYSKKFLSIRSILDYIDNYFGAVVVLVLKMFALAVCIGVVLYLIKYCSVFVKAASAKFAVKLFVASLFTYLSCIFKLVYLAGLSNILKAKAQD